MGVANSMSRGRVLIIVQNLPVPFDRRPVDDPAELGIDPTALDELFARAQKDIDETRRPGVRRCCARR